MLKRIFKYLEPIWCGDDKQPSIKRLLSLFFSVVFIVEVLKPNTQADVLWVIAALISALLSLTTFQAVSHANIDADIEKSANNVETITNKIVEKLGK